ncbi:MULTISPECIES: TetR/AcrR family transcriptional regulator [Leptotrichia]|jgi:transcriptional regulator, tetR family|uniref:TetR/AcrR family transcriptional regulator n=1 Tax=Leptotrichia TaxID=32067 RepID=UPI0003ADBAB5|nr:MULTISPECIES: TetR/AcrR family transcriptional regulator [Leptotrichia]ERL27099.1 transcriptional regulator, TetR family [Leptotrichia sp. oral taxon 225 str. F0581]WLD74184.1 TetR/AcrR family transcriptional regulator [Leptotrichia sp. HMT-225]
MTKEYNKNFIIQQSAKLFYYKGYKNTELTDIFKACDMPNDIFYKFFSSKEELLSSVIKYHTENLINFFNNNVDDLSIDKFHYFFEKYFENIVNNRFHGGSPLGNLALELSDLNNSIREELVKSYKKIELRFSFFITTLKYAFPKKYDDIVPETTARLLIALLEGTILMLKTEKESFAINDFFVFFDSLFKLDEDKKAEEQLNKETQETSDAEKKYISDSIKSEIIDSKSHEFNMQTDIKISEDILNKGIEETNQENIEIEVLEHESSSLDDNMYYELDSDSLINVFDDLENYQKNETEDDE